MKTALIFQGGWDGHEPQLTSKRYKGLLEKHGYQVTISDTLECLRDADSLLRYDLIVPCWTMGEIEDELVENVSKAVASGVGFAGCHGGMCDSFRQSVLWQFITGGQWVAHPGNDGVDYTVNICRGSSPITQGMEDFHVKSEQYYMHVDPAIEVLATTRFPVFEGHHTTNKPVDMPVAWTKFWGKGRVFFSSLGHVDNVFDLFPTASLLIERGMLWATK